MAELAPIVIYHANCSDGLGAAWACWRKFGDEAVYLPCSYGTDWREFLFDNPSLEYAGSHPEETEAFSEQRAAIMNLYIVDFSFPQQDILDMCHYFKSVTIFDHHDTARQDLETCPHRDNLHITFDMERSGAGITWDELNERIPRPYFINLIEDRDLWRFKYDRDSKAFQMYLLREKPDFSELRDLEQNSAFFKEILQAYKLVYDYHIEMVAEVAKTAFITTTKFFGTVAYVNAPYHMASDLGEVLRESADVVCIWNHAKAHPENISMSFRSKGTPHVGNLARDYFNGGGHPAAAGGWLSIEGFFQLLETGLPPVI